MEEATGAPSSFAVWDPKRLRASGRDGGAVMTRPPSPLTMLFSRHTKRREFIPLLGAAATPSMLWPLAARPQQPAMPLIGLLFRGSCEQMEELMAAFRKGLSETGYVEGRNVTFELRRASNEQDRLPELAADLVRRQVSVIASPGSDVAPPAATAATTSIPIVFSTGG